MIYTKPEEWQVRGATFLYKKKWGVLGFKTGKGKSLTLLACLHNYIYNKPTYSVLFGPKNAIGKVWPVQIATHSDMKYISLADALKNYSVHKSFDFLNDYDIILVKYSEVLKNYEILEQIVFDRITAYDEIHELKNPESKLHRVLFLITHKKAKAKWGLTATSLTNSIMDLWGVSQFLDPTFFGSDRMFKSRFCEMKDQVTGVKWIGKRKILKKVKIIDGYKNLDILRTQVEKFMIIVENDDLNVKYHKLYYEMNEYEEKVYLTAAEGILEKRSIYAALKINREDGAPPDNADIRRRSMSLGIEVIGKTGMESEHVNKILNYLGHIYNYNKIDKNTKNSEIIKIFKAKGWNHPDAYINKVMLALREKRNFKEFAQRIPDLQRVCDGSRDANMVGLKEYRSSKYKAYLSELNKIISHGESVLLFAENIETIDMLRYLLKEDMPNVPVYEMTGKKVDDPKDFPCVVICSSGGSASMNLAFANHVMFYSLPFSVEVFIQMVGRITRMDSEFKEDLNVYLPDTDKNVDLYKAKYLLMNADLINKVIGKDVNLPTQELGEVRRNMLKELRKELLWRTKELKKKTLIETDNTENTMENTNDNKDQSKIIVRKPDFREFRINWFSKQLDKLAYFVKSSEMAFFVTLIGVLGQTFHIYHVVFMISDLQGIPKILNTILWSVFFALGVLFFTLRSGTGDDARNKKYRTTVNMFTGFEALVNLYYWANRLIFYPAILFQYDTEVGIDWTNVNWASFQWSKVEWPSLIIAVPLALAIPLILRAYAGEIRLMSYGKFLEVIKKK